MKIIDIAKSTFFVVIAVCAGNDVLAQRYETRLIADSPPSGVSGDARRAGSVGFYDSTVDKTFVTWSGEQMDPYVKAFDHRNNRWGNAKKVTDANTTDTYAYHNYPHLIQADDGHLLVFWAIHQKNMFVNRSANPKSIEGSWRRIDIDNGKKPGYPFPIKTANGDIYVFFRHTIESTYRPFMYVKSTDDGRTWSSAKYVIHKDVKRPDGNNEIYLQHIGYEPAHHGKPERFLMSWTLAGAGGHNNGHRNLYAAYFHPDNDKTYAVDGTPLGDFINRAEEDAHCLILTTSYNNAWTIGHLGYNTYTDDGAPVVGYLYLKNGSYDVRVAVWDGNVWQKRSLYRTNSRYSDGFYGIERLGGRAFKLYAVNGADQDVKIIRTDDAFASWEDWGYIDKAEKINNAFLIDNYHTDVKLLMTEDVARSTRGDGKLWAVNEITTGTTPVSGVSLSPTILTLDTGQRFTLNARVSPENASNKSVNWRSSNPSVARVSASGVVEAVSDGDTKITVITADGGFSASADVTVTRVATTAHAIEAECGELGDHWNVYVDSTASHSEYIEIDDGLTSTANPPGARADAVRYRFELPASGTYTLWGRVIAANKSDDSFWVRVDGGRWIKWNNIPTSGAWLWDDVHDADDRNQRVAFNLDAGPHTLEIRYREDGTQLDKLYITSGNDRPTDLGAATDGCGSVTVPVTGVSIGNCPVEPLSVDASLELNARIVPTSATDQLVRWSSSDAAVATIDNTGLLNVTGEGVSTIRVVTNDGNYSARCELIVSGPRAPGLNTIIQAEDYITQQGINNKGDRIGQIDNHDWVHYRVDFSAGARSVDMRLAVKNRYAGQQLEFRLNAVDGPLIGTHTVTGTGGWDAFEHQRALIQGADGVRDVYVVGRGTEGIADIDWLRFNGQ